MSLRSLAILSGIYDLLIAIPMLFAAPAMAQLFGAPPPVPVLNAQLNGVFTLSLGLGYFWVAGVVTKGLGASLFVWDHFAHGSPASFLLFAATDGTLALVTLALLLRR